MGATTKPFEFLTFPPMIDSELCRFVLAHYGIAYRETPHLFGWASMLALFRAGSVRIPLLIGDGTSVAGSRAMVDHFEKLAPIEKKLIPADAYLAVQVEADYARFNTILGFATAVVGYYHLLPNRELMLEPFCRGLPNSEAKWLKSHYATFAGMFKFMLQLSAANERAALTQTRSVFDETDRRLADGRLYLVDDRLTLSDIAFATAAAPVLLPEGFSSPMPAFADMPAALKTIISEMRQRETARFVERIFRLHRNG